MNEDENPPNGIADIEEMDVKRTKLTMSWLKGMNNSRQIRDLANALHDDLRQQTLECPPEKKQYTVAVKNECVWNQLAWVTDSVEKWEQTYLQGRCQRSLRAAAVAHIHKDAKGRCIQTDDKLTQCLREIQAAFGDWKNEHESEAVLKLRLEGTESSYLTGRLPRQSSELLAQLKREVALRQHVAIAEAAANFAISHKYFDPVSREQLHRHLIGSVIQKSEMGRG